MTRSRLMGAMEGEGLEMPGGRVLLLYPPADLVLPPEVLSRASALQPNVIDHRAWADRGVAVSAEPPVEGSFAAALVSVPRSKPLARALVAEATQHMPTGLILIDGQKTDGVDSLYKECRGRVPILGSYTAAHGRIFWFEADASAFADWSPARPAKGPGGYVTQAGVFSADGPDAGSALLAKHLPARLGPAVADLGAGWGFLSAAALEREGVERLLLVEADHAALACARLNITDPRASFLWADATTPLGEKFDAVIMNPPFHIGRRADARLGQMFITAASRLLNPRGVLWMVANRHLPYEQTLADRFAQAEDIATTGQFKVIKASRPLR